MGTLKRSAEKLKKLLYIIPIGIIWVLFFTLEREEPLRTTEGRVYFQTFPESWKFTDTTTGEATESIELDLGGGVLIFLSAFSADNPVTLEQYCEIVTEGFPETHLSANSEHEVETVFTGVKTAIGVHEGLSAEFRIARPNGESVCDYRFFRKQSDRYVIFVEVFCEDAGLGQRLTEIEGYLSSIRPNS